VSLKEGFELNARAFMRMAEETADEAIRKELIRLAHERKSKANQIGDQETRTEPSQDAA
jgi:hypothetical protein